MGSVEEISIIDLDEIEVKGGNIQKILNKDSKHFFGFGELYFSNIECNAIKAWKLHKNMYLNLLVFKGEIRFVFFDQKKFLEINMSETKPKLLHVPPKIWFGFQGKNLTGSTLLNIASIRNDPEELERRDLEDIKFDWSLSL